jgi:hypothetical protein
MMSRFFSEPSATTQERLSEAVYDYSRKGNGTGQTIESLLHSVLKEDKS